MRFTSLATSTRKPLLLCAITLLVLSTADMASAKPAPRPAPKCHAAEQLVRVIRFEDRGQTVHVELADGRTGAALETLDVTDPGNYYRKRFSVAGSLACMPLAPPPGEGG